MFKRKAVSLLVVGLVAGCTGDDQIAAPRSYTPLFWEGESSIEEELIGSTIIGASANTQYTASLLHPAGEEPVGFSMWFTGSQAKHRYGIFSTHAECPDREQHYRSDFAVPHPDSLERHCSGNGTYSLSVGGGGATWFRTIAMLDDRGVPEETGAGQYQDVKVILSHNSSSSSLSGSMLRSATYYPSNQPGNFGSGDISVATGDSVWFISTYQATPDYNWQAILNSFNWDYNNPVSQPFRPAVNSANSSETAWFYPYNHIFRSPGRTRTQVVRLRVIRPHDLTMTGTLVADSVVVTIAADSACWTSAGGQVNQSISFSASCSEDSNSGVAEYQWSWGDGSSDSPWSTSTAASHTYSSSGSKSVKLRIRLNTGEGGMDSTTHNVTISPPPPSISIGNSPNPVKPKRSCNWSADAAGGTPPYAFTWFKNGSLVGSGQSVSIATGFSSFWLRFTVTDSLSATDSDSVYVTVTSSAPSDCVY